MKLATNTTAKIARILTKLADKQRAISRLQGNSAGSVLLLTPPPTEKEYAQNLPWCSESAEAFVGFLAQEVPDFDRSELLYLPPIFHGDKPSKATTEESLAIYELLIDLPSITRVLCVGAASFKLFIGRGTKPNMTTLVGQSIRLPTSRHKPVFTLPDPAPLVVPEGVRGRDAYILKREAENMSLRFLRLAPSLIKFLA